MARRRYGRTHYHNGQKWIRNEKRCAIYARDGFACAYCNGKPLQLKLDHVDPRGGNGEDNLVTCCNYCNIMKGDRTLHQWLEARAAAGEPTEEILATRQFVAMLTFLPIDLQKGKWLEAQRGRGKGSFARLRTKIERAYNEFVAEHGAAPAAA